MNHQNELVSIYPPTRRIYMEESYQKCSEAVCLAIENSQVILNQTIFYAESGGQDCDIGEINGIPVVNVQHCFGRSVNLHNCLSDNPVVQVDTVIYHEVVGVPDFNPGDTIQLAINWDRRYKLMVSHSLSHFLFYAVSTVLMLKANISVKTKGCHISPNGARFDFDNDIPAEWVPEIETMANQQILCGGAISMIPNPSCSGLFDWTYNKNIVIPCGGTHVGSSDELYPIKIKRKKQGRGITRLSFEIPQ